MHVENILLIEGCASVKYSPYVGKQQDWPTAVGSFMNQHKGFPIYKGLPDKAYTIIGEAIIEQYPEYMDAEIARIGKSKKADAAMLVDSQKVFGGTYNVGGGSTTYFQGQSSYQTYGSRQISGTHSGTAQTYSNPSYSMALTWDKTSVYLIKFK